jgi:hypothetical protein
MEKKLKKAWTTFHKFMKSGRLNKVCKKCLN